MKNVYRFFYRLLGFLLFIILLFGHIGYVGAKNKKRGNKKSVVVERQREKKKTAKKDDNSSKKKEQETSDDKIVEEKPVKEMDKMICLYGTPEVLYKKGKVETDSVK